MSEDAAITVNTAGFVKANLPKLLVAIIAAFTGMVAVAGTEFYAAFSETQKNDQLTALRFEQQEARFQRQELRLEALQATMDIKINGMQATLNRIENRLEKIE